MKKSDVVLILMVIVILALGVSWAKLRDQWLKISRNGSQKIETLQENPPPAKKEEPKQIEPAPLKEIEPPPAVELPPEPAKTFIPEQLSKAPKPPAEAKKPRCLEGIEFLSGFEWGKIHQAPRNYNVVPFLVDFNFNFGAILRKININPWQLVQFQIEPFLGLVTSPKSNVEAGTSFLFKVGLFPRDWKFQPYVKAGAGMIYVSQRFGEQGTKFNFIESGCFGAHYFIRKNIALTLEGRMRHLSNAGIKQPNHGVNSYFVVGGVSYEF